MVEPCGDGTQHQSQGWSIRSFAGTLADAKGILAVERLALHECEYTPEELQTRLLRPEQRMWVAVAGPNGSQPAPGAQQEEGQIVGFLSGLRTSRLAGPTLEVDLLAVHPAWRKQGIAAALLSALRKVAAADAQGLRGVVRPENPASERAFTHAGFTPSATVHDLFIYRILGTAPRPLPAWNGEIGPLAGPTEAAAVSALAPASLPPAERLWAACREPEITVLVARRAGAVVAAAELIEVHTMLYSGLWLESLALGPQGRAARKALVAAAVELAKARDLDEVGCLVAEQDQPLRSTLLGEGFVPLDHYRIWSAPPLTGGGQP